jgi:hypothetical protein
MKTLIAIGLLFSAGVQAETITLGPVGCGILKQCLEIPNDSAVDASIYASPSLPAVNLYLTTYDALGVPTKRSYRSPAGNGVSFTSLQLQDSAGNIVLLTASFSTFRTCTRSGRGQTCSMHWNLLGGTIVK